MNFVSRMTAGRGMVSRSERTTRSDSDSTISAFPSMTSRSARRMGTMVRGSNEAFNARHPTITKVPPALYVKARGVSEAEQDKLGQGLRAARDTRQPFRESADGCA